MQQNGTVRLDTARSGRGSLALITALVLLLLLAASAYLFLPERIASLVVLACLGILSTAGVVALFAGAAGMLSLQRPSEMPEADGVLYSRVGAGYVLDFYGTWEQVAVGLDVPAVNRTGSGVPE